MTVRATEDLTHRLVVPSFLMPVLRAEQTTATLLLLRLVLKALSIRTAAKGLGGIYRMMFWQISCANLPTDVPPYFWQTQLLLLSFLYRALLCPLGRVFALIIQDRASINKNVLELFYVVEHQSIESDSKRTSKSPIRT